MKTKMEILKNMVTNVTIVTKLIYRELLCNLSVTFVTYNVLLIIYQNRFVTFVT